MIELTFDRALELAKQAVEERGEDYVYSPPKDDEGNEIDSCVYVHNGAPSCLVGEVMFRAGVPLEAMLLHNESNVNGLVMELDAIVQVDTRTEFILSGMQGEQDNGTPWGRSVSRAVESLKWAVEHGDLDEDGEAA